MFFYPYYRNEEKSFIRVFHASPDAPAVDVYANGVKIAGNLKYRQFTEYLKVTPGIYNIKVYPAGTKTNPVIATKYKIEPETITTIAAIGTLDSIHLLPIDDPILAKVPDKASVRFSHLSPNTPSVDVTLPDGTIIFENVSYEETSDYIEVDPGKYTLQARPTGTDKIALIVPNIHLKPNRFYTVYAIGLLGGNPPLQVVIPLDGNTYIDF
ncbi:DUF4397 domain-containing protein [Clostridium sp. DL1XJH146]